jgi:hypothetical protein
MNTFASNNGVTGLLKIALVLPPDSTVCPHGGLYDLGIGRWLLHSPHSQLSQAQCQLDPCDSPIGMRLNPLLFRTGQGAL